MRNSAYAETKKKLVDVYGFPSEVLELEYDHAYMVRGLVVDKTRGNVLKMDRHKYVKVARHGFEPLSTESRIETYCATSAKADQFSGPEYANVDTLFALGETYLFCQLVELKERYVREGVLNERTDPSGEDPSAFDAVSSSDDATKARKRALASKPFAKMYDEIRASVDLCHRDGTLKRAVADDPGLYIHADKELVPMLRALRASGKKVFLLTNSLWDFTNVVMNFLVADRVGEEKTVEWTELFDAVITGACKPGFFENERAAVFEVDVETSGLRNTDDGAPMSPIGASEAEDAPFAGLASLKKKRKNPPPPRARVPRRLVPAPARDARREQRQPDFVRRGPHLRGRDAFQENPGLAYHAGGPRARARAAVPGGGGARGAFENIRALRRERDELSDAAQLRMWRAFVNRDTSIESGTGWSSGTALNAEPLNFELSERARAADPEDPGSRRSPRAPPRPRRGTARRRARAARRVPPGVGPAHEGRVAELALRAPAGAVRVPVHQPRAEPRGVLAAENPPRAERLHAARRPRRRAPLTNDGETGDGSGPSNPPDSTSHERTTSIT